MQNGIISGPLLIAISATMSWYTGTLLISAMDYSGKSKYEDIAKRLYGRKYSILVICFVLMMLLAANISYTVYVKSFYDNLY